MSSDLRDVLAPARPITRTIGGREYQYPRTIEARFGLLIADGVNGTRDAYEYISKDEQFDLRDIVFGPARKDMIRGGCTDAEMDIVFSYLCLHHVLGEAAANAYWDGLGKPQTPRDDVEPSTTSPSTGADGATSTASTSGTSTPRKKTTPRKKAPANRSRGR